VLYDSDKAVVNKRKASFGIGARFVVNRSVSMRFLGQKFEQLALVMRRRRYRAALDTNLKRPRPAAIKPFAGITAV